MFRMFMLLCMIVSGPAMALDVIGAQLASMTKEQVIKEYMMVLVKIDRGDEKLQPLKARMEKEFLSPPEKGKAQASLGYMYATGKNGFATDLNLATKWYRQSIAYNSPLGLESLLLLHYAGKVTLPAGELASLTRKLDAAGPEAQLSLAGRLLKGEDGIKNEPEAFRWASKAAQQNYGPAMKIVTAMHAQGVGVEKNTVLAQDWSNRMQRAGVKSDGHGTAFLLTPNHMLTNEHVAGDCQTISTEYNGRRIALTLVDKDPLRDLAILKASAPLSQKVIPLASQNTTKIGDPVFAAGFAPNTALVKEGKVVVPFTRQKIQLRSMNEMTIRDMMLTSASTNHGDSGGPVVNHQGHLIAVNSMGSKTVGAAVPLASVKTFLAKNNIRYTKATTTEPDVKSMLSQVTFKVECSQEKAASKAGGTLAAN